MNTTTETDFDEARMLRYSRQIALPCFGFEGQQTLFDSCVLVIGLGGLGVPLATYLATSGVGKLILVDSDLIELANLHRQPMYREKDIGASKAEVTAERLAALNSEIEIQAINKRADEALTVKLASEARAVADCSDNFPTRHAVNRACWKTSKPLVSAAVIRMEGQLAVFDPRTAESPCYACLYPDQLRFPEEACVDNGIVAPVAGLMGCAQALEIIKLLLGIGPTLSGKLFLLDARFVKWREISLRKDAACSVCGGGVAKLVD